MVGCAALGWTALRGNGAVMPVAQDVPGPVLLVPGYGGSVASLAPMVKAVEALGRTAVVVTVADKGEGDLRDQAKRLGDVADEAMGRANASSVDVIGYSAGGVVARLWVRDYGGGSVARRVVTVGSPHHGTEIAALGQELAPGACGTACQQLAPDSSLLRGLNAGDETPVGPRFVSMWSTSDEVVRPAESARLEGALNFTIQSVCASDRAAHGALPGDAVVLAALPDLIGKALPKAPTAGTC